MNWIKYIWPYLYQYMYRTKGNQDKLFGGRIKQISSVYLSEIYLRAAQTETKMSFGSHNKSDQGCVQKWDFSQDRTQRDKDEFFGGGKDRTR